ncbi:hypothetical protein F4861DRAFT_491412 [Xylaria intraflava]|nr:hypothetical protein F4861DRAFT_491412 [Xylaria intraflava]
MAGDAPASDLSLLERLNALKPSSVSLSPAPSAKINSTSIIERAKAPSREDALTSRLRSLRDRGPESSVSDAKDQHGGDGGSTESRSTEETESFTRHNLESQQFSMPIQITDDVDPLLHTDDETLEELLADLRSDDAWLDEMAAEEEHRRVTALLKNLSGSASASADLEGQDATRIAPQKDGEDSSTDDSEGELMSTEIDSVLAKAMDEMEWEKANQPRSLSPQPVSTPPSPPQKADQSRQGAQDGGHFNLPTVPSEPQGQADMPALSEQTKADADFAASIASRMAALKLSGPRALPSVPNTAVDALGLPQVPTSALSDSPVPGLAGRSTDETQRNWCVVCLEDGTVRCLGCETGDNMYCARCWKEMHVGPRAGYDERGHSWEMFVSRPR